MAKEHTRRWRDSAEIEQAMRLLQAQQQKAREDFASSISISASLANVLLDICWQAKRTEDGHMEPGA